MGKKSTTSGCRLADSGRAEGQPKYTSSCSGVGRGCYDAISGGGGGSHGRWATTLQTKRAAHVARVGACPFLLQMTSRSHGPG
ncbi:hypothetical protein NL676_011319 [Syzygium grande]|nr:hypothetical protein NL676_011319 [Syzygium grande]